MNRRSFIRLIALSTASGLVPAFISASEAIPSGATSLCLMREVTGFDPINTLWLLRFDVLHKSKTQLGVDFEFLEQPTEKQLSEHRLLAKENFESCLKADGLSWNDLIPLEWHKHTLVMPSTR